MAEYQAQLVAVEAKLVKDPENEELLSLKNDLIELIELSGTIEDEPAQQTTSLVTRCGSSSKDSAQRDRTNLTNDSSSSRNATKSEADLLAKKKEKNKKKKAKLREKIKEQLDIAEGEKQSWQSFANRKGLKGLNKKSIFASPHSTTGKVGVGTNGIADAPSVRATATSSSSFGAKRK